LFCDLEAGHKQILLHSLVVDVVALVLMCLKVSRSLNILLSLVSLPTFV